MGNGNQHGASRSRTHSTLPTPHGEREPFLSSLPPPKSFFFQPLMGNGNAFALLTAYVTSTLFQPLMGNGNSSGQSGEHLIDRLPTPHGEREPDSGRSRAGAVRSSNPSWGTGTSTRITAGERQQDLPTPHGERELAIAATRFAALTSLPTPHGEREPRSPTMCGFSTLSFQPLMGNGNRIVAEVERRKMDLPTPHGEREPRRPVATA